MIIPQVRRCQDCGCNNIDITKYDYKYYVSQFSVDCVGLFYFCYLTKTKKKTKLNLYLFTYFRLFVVHLQINDRSNRLRRVNNKFKTISAGSIKSGWITAMARHLMAVCVVCLLCADHLPCKEHILASDNLPSLKHINAIIGSEKTEPRIPGSDITGTYMYDKRKDKTKSDDDEDVEKSLIRTRRHADHSTEHEHHPHHHEIAKVTKTYVELIFERFGNSTTNTMNLQDFDKMLHELNLTHLITNKLPEPTKAMPAVTDNSQSCMSSLDFVEKMTEQKSEKLKEYKEHQHEHDHDHVDHKHEPHLESTLRAIDTLNSTSWLADIKSSLLIEHEHFTSICPILLYHIAGKNSSERGGCLNNAYFAGKEIYANEEPEMEDRGKVWLYSTLSLVGISLCGLLGVAVIPIMEKHFYHHVLQFLVALAVGTLCGDALLHLLPHVSNLICYYRKIMLIKYLLFTGNDAIKQ